MWRRTVRRVWRSAWFPILLAGIACHNNGDTLIVNSDCGLIRSDLLGTWNVTFQPATASLFNCSDPAFDNLAVTVSSIPFSFSDVEVFASASNAGFQFHNGSDPQKIFGNVETDSCNMLFAFLATASDPSQTKVYLQCIGSFDRQTGVLSGSCDSTTVLETPVVDPATVLADCDLNPILRVTLAIQ